MYQNPFDIVIYDADFNFIGFVVDPIYLNFVPSWANQGYGNFSVAADNPHIAALQQDGARLTVHYKGEHVISGPIRSYIGDIAPRGYVTFQVSDDRRILVNTILYPNPGRPLAPTGLDDVGQGWVLDGDTFVPGSNLHQYGYFHWPDGSSFDTVPAITDAETAAKYVVQRQCIDRLGLPITIAPNLQRGPGIVDYLPKVRMVPLSEVMTPIMTAAGLGVKLWQDAYGKTINFDVVEPGEWTQPLTLESGIIASGSYTRSAPTITRPMNAGPGETVSMAFRGTEGKTRTPEEVAWGDVIELYNQVDGFADLNWPKAADGTDLPDDQKAPKYFPFKGAADDVAAFEKSFAVADEQTKATGASTVGLSLKLQESETFYYGGKDGLQLGDYVTVVIRGQEFREQVTEVQMDFTRDNGLVIAPLVGDYVDDPDKIIARKIASLYKAYRRTQAMR